MVWQVVLMVAVVGTPAVRRTRRVVAVLSPQEVLALHLALQTGDVPVAEVLA